MHVSTDRFVLLLFAGSLTETLYALGTFGIRRDDLPVNDLGRVNKANGWVESRRLQEKRLVGSSNGSLRAGSPLSATSSMEDGEGIVPQPNDILMGEKTRQTQIHPGNIFYRYLIEERLPEYNTTPSRKIKSNLRNYVLLQLRERGGRFLTREQGPGWSEIKEEKYIRRRINQAFRNSRRKNAPTSRGRSQQPQEGGMDYTGMS